MPPRYAYWTILIDNKPTAFRAREREELQPTLAQLQRKQPNVTLRWFARGKLWESREAEQADFQQQRRAALEPRDRRDRPAAAERRGSDWRPGGAHKDPRDRFKKKNRPERAWSEKDPATQRDRDKAGYAAKRPDWRDRSGPPKNRPQPSGGTRAWTGKPPDKSSRQSGDRPWAGKPRSDRPWRDAPSPPNDRPWQTKPTGPRAQRKPWNPRPDPAAGSAFAKPRHDRPWRDKPAGQSPRGDRPWTNSKPGGAPPRSDRPWANKAGGGAPRGDRPWNRKPNASDGDRPRNMKPPAGGQRPWSGKPRDANRKPFVPRGPGGPPRKRRDDED
jgi:hypothetical protein